jgi:hypothetical protein
VSQEALIIQGANAETANPLGGRLYLKPSGAKASSRSTDRRRVVEPFSSRAASGHTVPACFPKRNRSTQEGANLTETQVGGSSGESEVGAKSAPKCGWRIGCVTPPPARSTRGPGSNLALITAANSGVRHTRAGSLGALRTSQSWGGMLLFGARLLAIFRSRRRPGQA